MFKNFRAFCVCVLSVFAFSAVAKDVVANFEPTHEPDAVLIHSNVEADSYVLTVKGAQASFKQEFGGDETPMATLADPDGNVLPDGLYLYEVTPTFAPSAENSNYDEFDRLAMKIDGAARMAHSGSFRIVDGQIIDPNLEEVALQSVTASGKTETPATDADAGRAQVYTTDVIVQGSECVGFDCATSESFGSDTFRLKENNLRIHFEDTSASASFPTNDWRIAANDTTNGGAEYLAIQDATAGTTPFKIDAGAGNNAIVAESGGFVGFGTSNPTVNLHVKDGNSPALRLEQDGSDGFASQAWDIAGNETNFFIRDVTNSSKLPFRIKPGAAKNSIFIDAAGEVGMGNENPDSKLHITGTSSTYALHIESSDATGNANVLIEDTEETTDLDTMIEYKNHGPLQFQMSVTDPANLAAWVFKTGYSDFVIKENANNSKAASFVFNEDGSFDFKGSTTSDSASNTLLTMDASGNLTAAGTVTGSSDVTIKSNHGLVDPMSILAKVSELPIARWSYNADECETEHLGPMSQDFHEAFGLGASDTGIAFVDSDGVALASIQALNTLVEQKDARIEELEAKSAALEARLAAIEKALLNK